MEKPLLLIVRLSTSVTEILETGILRAEQAESAGPHRATRRKVDAIDDEPDSFVDTSSLPSSIFHRTEVDGRIVGNALAFGEAEDEHVVGASLFQPRESLGHISVVTVNSQLQ